MKPQAYYRIKQAECNFCDNTEAFLINCAGFSKQKVCTKTSRHDYYLMYVTDGEMSFKIKTDTSKIKTGQFIIISPETTYLFKTHSDDVVSYLWLHFTGNEIPNFLSKCKLSLNTVYEIGMRRPLSELWQKMFNELILCDNLFEVVSVSLLKEIFAYLSRYVYTKSISQAFTKSIVYIHENYSSEISISTLAELENMCLTSYRKKFHELLGCSAKEYIIDIRLNHASQLLTETDFKLKQIASLVGYNDVYYFSRIFKKKMGISPQNFKNKNGSNPALEPN